MNVHDMCILHVHHLYTHCTYMYVAHVHDMYSIMHILILDDQLRHLNHSSFLCRIEFLYVFV